VIHSINGTIIVNYNVLKYGIARHSTMIGRLERRGYWSDEDVEVVFWYHGMPVRMSGIRYLAYVHAKGVL
jgi:hypothetical protein